MKKWEMTAPTLPSRLAAGSPDSRMAPIPCCAMAWSCLQVNKYEMKDIKRNTAISRKITPVIFPVRSSRAKAFQSIDSSFSTLNDWERDAAEAGFFFSVLLLVFFFSLLAMNAKITNREYYLKVAGRPLLEARPKYYIYPSQPITMHLL